MLQCNAVLPFTSLCEVDAFANNNNSNNNKFLLLRHNNTFQITPNDLSVQKKSKNTHWK